MLLLIPLIAVLGCQSKKDYEKALADAQTLAAEKDSLLSEVLETSKFVTSVNEELARSKSTGGSAATAGDPGVPGPEADRAARAAALKKVQDLVAHQRGGDQARADFGAGEDSLRPQQDPPGSDR
jgi:outer membrane murein-binding lipoprotein Lpp